MATEAVAPAVSDHPAPSEELEAKPQSEAKKMEAEASPVKETKVEPPSVNEEDDVKGSVDVVATTLDEEEKKTHVAEHEQVELPAKAKEKKPDLGSASEPIIEKEDSKLEEKPEAELGEEKIGKEETVEEKPSEKSELEVKSETTVEETIEKETECKAEEVLNVEEKPSEKTGEKLEKVEEEEVVETIKAKDVIEAECKVEEEDSLVAPIVEEKSGVKNQILPKEEESGLSENPTILVEKDVAEVKEKIDQEKDVEDIEKVSEHGKIEATSEEKRSPTNDTNVVGDEVTDRDVKLIADNPKIEEAVGGVKAELEGEKQVDEPVNVAKSSDPLPELIAEDVKTKADIKEGSDETESIKETVQATEEKKIEETVGAVKAEIEGEKQVDEHVGDSKTSDTLPELIAKDVKTEDDKKEGNEETDKNVAKEEIKETVGAIEAELEGEKLQVDEAVKDSKEIEDNKKPQDAPAKTQKQSIVKMVKQSLVKAKKAITGKSHNSKTPASEPKEEGN